MPDIEIVTVFHRPRNRELALRLRDALEFYEPDVKLHMVDNMTVNRGFAKACNLGATWCDAPIIGFLNPDVEIAGPFSNKVVNALRKPDTVIGGNGYHKPKADLKLWGIDTFICGACMFVDREWFASVGGFDQQFIWSHEETDLIRRAEEAGMKVRELRLPIRHESPQDDNSTDLRYKQRHFKRSAIRYAKKWGRR